jgi:chaperonin cofactor prefoldin
MTDPDNLYWTEKIHHALDLIDNRMTRLEKDQAHRIELLLLRVETLERSQTDQEVRLRTIAEGVIRLNTQGSLAAVGQSILSLILAAIAAYIGAK